VGRTKRGKPTEPPQAKKAQVLGALLQEIYALP